MSKEVVQTLVDRAIVVYKPTGANIHKYTNKTATPIGMAELVDFYVSKGKVPSHLVTALHTSLMDMYKWIDREYNRSLY